MTFSEFDQLKELILLRVGRNEKFVIHELKELFKDDINSVRRFELIDTIKKLLEVLELRDVLSETKIDPLKTIVERLPNCDALMKKIEEYETSRHFTKSHINSYASQNTMGQGSPPEESSMKSNPIGGIMSERKKKRILATVTKQIGTFWRELGRNLKLRESEIDDINDLHCSLPSKAAMILEAYDEIADPQRWFFVLCDALEKTRRKDLARSLQEIMAMNI